jgi:hypothetical protein
MTDQASEPAITVHRKLPYDLHAPVWEMYTAAFEPLRKRAAQRHVMFHSEYVDLMEDDRVDKILAHDNLGDPLGLAVVTNDLKAILLIEPEYFEAREPDLYAAGHVWYTAFVCTRQRPRAPRVTFQRLIEKVAEPIRPVRGVCFMDYAQCTADRDLPMYSNRLLAIEDPNAEAEQVDAQTYWGYYPGGRPL